MSESLQDPNFGVDWNKGFQTGLYSGIKTEQERIIKLLTNHSTEIADMYWYRGEGKPEKAFAFLIALIKGEQK